MPIQRETRQYWDIRSTPETDRPLELTHYAALYNSVINIFRTPYGDRGALFNPDWGSHAHNWLHEPLHPNVADSIKMALFNDLRKNHQMVKLDMSATLVVPVESLPGYYVKLVISSAPYIDAQSSIEFNLSKVGV